MRHLQSKISLGILFGSLLGLCGMTVAACTPGTYSDEEDVREAGMTFEEFLAVVYQEPDTGIYIVNGDTPIRTMAELRAFYEEHVRQGALAVHQANGVDAAWSSTQKRSLTYCVSTTFGNNHSNVVTAMSQAASAWERAADIKFVYASAHNSNCTADNASVVFDVRPVSGQSYLARAFFPNFDRAQRNILIDSSSFGTITPYTLAGVLRHELGHALGFRHEHTRPEAGVCFEDDNWRALTNYDAASVMHYPQCNGTNNGDLVLTARDREGAAALYGLPPCSSTCTTPGFCGGCSQNGQATTCSAYNGCGYPFCETACSYGVCGSCIDYGYQTSCYVYNGCGGKYYTP
jgi:serine protease